MFTAKRTLIACFGLIGIAAANAAPAPTRLAPADIQKTFFNGQTFTSSTPSNIQFKMTFTEDGKVVHDVEELQAELLHRDGDRRQQMVGDEGSRRRRRVEQVALTCTPTDP